MATTAAINIVVNGGDAAKSLRQLKDEFKDLNKQLENTIEGSEQYYNTLRKIADTKDSIKDLNDAIGAQTGAGKFQALANVGTQIAAGFSLAQGAMALFGSESKEVEQALLKVQAAQALLAGVKELEGLADTFKNAGTAVKSLLSDIGLLTAAQKIYNFIASINPYVLMIAGAAALTAGIYALVKAFEAEGTQAERLNQIYEARKRANDELEKSIQNEITALEGLDENEEKIIQKKRQLIQLQVQEAKLRVLATDAAEKEANKELSWLDQITAKTVTLFGITKKEDDYKKVKNQEEIKNKKDAIDELNKLLAESQKFENEQEQKRIDERNKNKHNALVSKEDMVSIEIEKVEAINDVVLRGEMKKVDGLKVLMDIEAANRKAIQERNQKFAIDNYAQTFQTIGALFTAFAGKSEESQKRAFNVNKAAGIAEATISSILAAQKAFTSQMIPGDPTSPIRAAIAASLAVAAGVARVAAIARTQFNSGASGVGGASIGGGADGGGSFNPNLNNPISSTSTLLVESGLSGEKKANPIKVYLPETDITNAINKVDKITKKAEIE